MAWNKKNNKYENQTKPEIYEFEKWHAIRASVGGVGGVLAWVAWVACLCGWRGWRASVGDVPAWVIWVVYVYVFTCVLFRFGLISQITN